MRIIYTPSLAESKDLTVLRQLSSDLVIGTTRDHLRNTECSVCVIRGGEAPFTREVVHDFIEHVQGVQSYAYADLTYAGRPEMVLEFFSEDFVRQIRNQVDLFLPDGSLDMKYAHKPVVHAFEDCLLTGFVSVNSNAYRYPRGICLEPSSACNFKCTMCTWQVTHPPKINRGPKTMPFEYFEKLAAEISQWPIKPGVEFCWRGEPLLNARLFEAIALFSKIGCYTYLYTNGQLFDAEAAAKVKASGLASLFFSIDGLDPETYESIDVGGDYDVVMENLDRAIRELRSGPDPIHVGVKMVRMDENRKHWDALFERFENCVDTVTLQNQVYFEDDQYRCKNMFGFQPRKFCVLPWQSAVISANGDVYSCGATNTEDEEEVIGNIANESLLDVWNGQKMAALRRQMLDLNVQPPFQCARCSRMVCAAGLLYQTKSGEFLDRTLEGVRYASRITTASASEDHAQKPQERKKTGSRRSFRRFARKILSRLLFNKTRTCHKKGHVPLRKSWRSRQAHLVLSDSMRESMI